MRFVFYLSCSIGSSHNSVYPSCHGDELGVTLDFLHAQEAIAQAAGLRVSTDLYLFIFGKKNVYFYGSYLL